MIMSRNQIVVLVCLAYFGLCAGAVIEPRPVNNQKDPRDGELFEWEAVDDDPWPGPSFTFPRLPGIDSVESFGQRRSDLRSPEVQLRAELLMQIIRSIFGNVVNYNANDVYSFPSPQDLAEDQSASTHSARWKNSIRKQPTKRRS